MVKFFREKVITEKVLTGIKCDKCGKMYFEREEEIIDGRNCIVSVNDMFEIQEFNHINFTGGYGSEFGDQDKVECDICQHCLKEMIGDFCRITRQYDIGG